MALPRKIMKASVRIAGILTDIQSQEFLNLNQNITD
jgi:hypothetical protein